MALLDALHETIQHLGFPPIVRASRFHSNIEIPALADLCTTQLARACRVFVLTLKNPVNLLVMLVKNVSPAADQPE